MSSRIRVLTILMGSLYVTVGVQASESAPALDFFEKRIRPALVKHCYECHSAESKELQGELQVDDRDALRQGGASGPAVVPGKPEESLLLEAIRYESFEMPPTGRLPDRVIRDFERWIESGAVDPRQGATIVSSTIDMKAGREFWSFQPPQNPKVPSVRDTEWPRNVIDHFILTRLESEGIRPNDLADRRTLVRRIYFDLVGLPPTVDQLESVLADASAHAIPRLVDRLLASSDFGPHWGRHWLDVVRYSDSSGGGRTRILRDAWRYRDYVVDAFNFDLPYDTLLAEQIAGDLLPCSSDAIRARQLTATGFLALGPTNYELQDKELLRMEVVDEQIDTLGRAVLGMTIGCARCHDHKFDPIPTSDYYALAGVLRSTKTLIHANVSDLVERELPVSPERRAQLDEHASAIAKLNQQLKQLQAQLGAADSSRGTAVAVDKLPGIVVDDSQAELVGQWTPSNHTPRYVAQGYRHDGAKDKGSKRATFKVSIPSDGEYEVRLSYSAGTNRSTQVSVQVGHADGQTRVNVDQSRKPPIDGLFVALGTYRFEAASAATVQIANRGTSGHVILDAVQFLPTDRSIRSAEAHENRRESERLQTEVKRVKADLEQLSERAPTPAPKVMSVMEEDEPSDFNICIRGNVHNLGERVPRGFLRAADQVDSWTIPKGASGRRELADWVTDPNNPLVARVMANRIWHHLMGAGLVRTPDNFGNTGELPSHPQLLDFLARELIRHDWSVKALIREIVNSRVYQLSSASQPQAAALDPENRLHWRAERRRLTAEQIRDAILSCSGELDQRMGGPSVDAQINSEFNYVFTGNRRSVYVPVFRNTLMDLLEVFDVADPNIVVGRRNVSTRPTQALLLMNSPLVLKQAGRLAAEVEALRLKTRAAKIDWLFVRTLGRPATELERETTTRFIDKLTANDQMATADAWTAVAQSLFACVDFRYLR